VVAMATAATLLLLIWHATCNLHQNDLLFHIGCSSPVNAAGVGCKQGNFSQKAAESKREARCQ
jgi:hypothetical protein